MSNNLFRWATSELSQDAFICWCLNWYNDDSRSVLRDMAISLIHRMAGDVDVQSVDLIRQYSKKVKVNGKDISVKVDVLAIINHSIGLIIEDKTFTGVHDNQIYRYVDGIKQILANENGKLEVDWQSYQLDSDKIKTVFWKTGFHYDYDQAVSADVKLDGAEVLRLLSPYRGESDILDDYLDNLTENLAWYEEFGNFTSPHMLNSGEAEYDWHCNVANYQYPQYRLMRTIFPAELWTKKADCKCELYQVYHGSSFGRPWTEMVILYGVYPGTKDGYEFFWRIDTDNDGPYLSLRLYEAGLNEKNKDRHKEKYQESLDAIRSVTEEGTTPIRLAWSEVNPGYRGSYKEASIFHLHLKDYLAHWQTRGEDLAQTLRKINDKFLARMEQ